MAEKTYRFPLFVDLRGRRAVVVGGGPVALRRAKALLDFGAQVTLIAPGCGAVPPGADYRLESGDVAVTLGRNDDINRLQDL